MNTKSPIECLGVVEEDRRFLRGIADFGMKPLWKQLVLVFYCAASTAFFAGMFYWLSARTSSMGMEICQRHRTIWVPLDGKLEKLIQTFVILSLLIGLFLILSTVGQFLHVRRLFQILSRIAAERMAKESQSSE